MSAPLIRQLRLQNFLSFGPEGVDLELRPLNVLIGPNASGKSNLIEALSILHALPGDLQAAIREGGGAGEYLWKGGVFPEIANISTTVGLSRFTSTIIIDHRIELMDASPRLSVWSEEIERVGGVEQLLFHSEDGDATVYPRQLDSEDPADTRGRPVREFNEYQSVLAQLRDFGAHPEISHLSDQFASIAIFGEWSMGRRTLARLPQPTDLPSDFLLPDARNLGLVIHDIVQVSVRREQFVKYLRSFFEGARHVSTKVQGGTIQLFIEEEGGRLIPATRLSDGTLRYLCLLAILLHPNPPPVVAIEEPELGLHPDIMPTIAELLKKASERTQLFVTTHSDALVSALSETPESILVCEATPEGTSMRRLEEEPLREWLKDYSLGEIWRMGEIGGNRW